MLAPLMLSTHTLLIDMLMTSTVVATGRARKHSAAMSLSPLCFAAPSSIWERQILERSPLPCRLQAPQPRLPLT